MNGSRAHQRAERKVHGKASQGRYRRISQVSVLAVLGVVLALGLAGCAGTPRSDLGPVFPPHPLRPLRLAIAPPLETFDLGVLHESLTGWSPRASERWHLIRCTWQEGVPTLANLAWPATEMSAVIMVRWPLGPSRNWCEFAGDDPDSLIFTLTADKPVDYARRRGLSHLLVPRSLVYELAIDDGDSVLVLWSDLAIVDIIEGRVVWTGRVGARREDVRLFRDIEPDLTGFERATYAWLVDLARVFERMETGSHRRPAAYRGAGPRSRRLVRIYRERSRSPRPLPARTTAGTASPRRRRSFYWSPRDLVL